MYKNNPKVSNYNSNCRVDRIGISKLIQSDQEQEKESMTLLFCFREKYILLYEKKKKYRRYDYEYKFSNYAIRSIGFRTCFNGS